MSARWQHEYAAAPYAIKPSIGQQTKIPFTSLPPFLTGRKLGYRSDSLLGEAGSQAGSKADRQTGNQAGSRQAGRQARRQTG